MVPALFVPTTQSPCPPGQFLSRVSLAESPASMIARFAVEVGVVFERGYPDYRIQSRCRCVAPRALSLVGLSARVR